MPRSLPYRRTPLGSAQRSAPGVHRGRGNAVWPRRNRGFVFTVAAAGTTYTKQNTAIMGGTPTLRQASAGTVVTTGTGTVSLTNCSAGNVVFFVWVEDGSSNDSDIGNSVNLAKVTDGTASDNDFFQRISMGGNAFLNIHVARVIADGTVSADVTVGGSGADCFIVAYEFEDVDTRIGSLTSQPITETLTDYYDFASGTGTTISMSSVISNDRNRTGVAFIGVNANQALAASTGESGGDWTEPVAEFASASGTAATVGIQTASMPTATTISGGTITISSASWGVLTTGLKPSGMGVIGVANKTFAKTGAGISAFVASGADADTFAETGAGISARVASGADAGTFAETGAGIAAFTVLGSKSKTSTQSGTGISTFVGSGTDATTYVETGAGISAFVASGADAVTSAETGAGISAHTVLGARASTLSKSGRGTWGAYTLNWLSDTTLTTGVSSAVGDTPTQTKVGQPFIADGSTPSVVLRYGSAISGTPSDHLRVGIQADSAGSPSGTFLDSTTIDPTSSAVTYTSALNASLTAGSTYWVVFERTGGLDAANFYRVYLAQGSYNHSPFAKRHDGSVWGAAINLLTVPIVVAGNGAVASGADATTYVETGAGVSAFTVLGARATDHLRTGVGIAPFSASGTSEKIAGGGATYTKQETAVSVFSADAADAITYVETGAGVSAFTVLGTRAVDHLRAETAISAFSADAADALTYVETGAGVTAYVASGTRTKTMTQTGIAVIGP